MNTSLFIAKRLYNTKENNNNYTRPIIRIAILAIALSVAVMLLSVIVLSGFKNNISEKVIGFGSHIKISKFNNNQSYENDPLDFDLNMYSKIQSSGFVKNIQVFSTKAGIIKNNNEILGVVLKGVGNDFNWSFFNENLISGEIFPINDSLGKITNNILISESISKKIGLKSGDNLIMYFIQEPSRVRKFLISGIYKTGLSEFDDIIIIGDIKHIQNLNDWNNNKIGGYEIVINDFDKLEENTKIIDDLISYDLNAQSIKEINPQIFDWLALQDFNVLIIIILMLIVGSVNMITSLLIIILEKSKFIGILKAIGASNWSIRKVFLYNSIYLILNGLFWGNSFALSFAFLQQSFNIISLDETIYFMNSVPISIDLSSILMINIGTVIICYLTLIIPSIIITKISPVKSIRFE
ncbi:MAG: ABC transporter permease [Flavobacteriales bacterium]|nr:ABC transporter permease [Flavobacteriales bacterium]